MQKKRIQSKWIQIKFTLNVKKHLQNQLKSVLPNITLFWTYFQKMELFLSEWTDFLRSKNDDNSMKMCFLIRLRTHA